MAARPPLAPGQTQPTAPVNRVAAWEAVRRRRKRFKMELAAVAEIQLEIMVVHFAPLERH